MDLFVIFTLVAVMVFFIGIMLYLDWEESKYWENEWKEGRVTYIYIKRL